MKPGNALFIHGHGSVPAALLVASGVLLLTSACAAPIPTASLLVRQTDAGLGLAGDAPDASELSDPGKGAFLSAALGETVSFAISVRCGRVAVPLPRLEWLPRNEGSGAGDAIDVSFFRMHPVRIEHRPGWHLRFVPPSRRVANLPDVLVPVDAPVGGWPEMLRPGTTYEFWADVTVGNGARPGRGSLRIVLTSRGAIVDMLDVALWVRPFELPRVDAVPMMVDLDHHALFSHHVVDSVTQAPAPWHDWSQHPRSHDLDLLLTSTVRLLREHRLTPVLSRLDPRVHIRPDGGAAVDWTNYDRVVRELLNEGLPAAQRGRGGFLPVPLGPIAQYQAARRGANAGPEERFCLDYLRECAVHFENSDWLDICYADPAELARFGLNDEREWERMARWIGATQPPVPLVFRPIEPWLGEWNADASAAGLFLESHVLAPRARAYDPAIMARHRVGGGRVWFEVDVPPFSGCATLSAASSDTRILAWQGSSLRAQAIRLGLVNPWPAAVGAGPQDCIRHDDSLLIYPGRRFGLAAPVASVRLKYLRRSQQDAAYLALLAQRGMSHLANALTAALCPRAGIGAARVPPDDGWPPAWPVEQSAFEHALAAASRCIEAAATGPLNTRHLSDLESTVAWHLAMGSPQDIDILPQGARVRLVDPQASLTAVEVWLALLNEGRMPQRVTVTLCPGQAGVGNHETFRSRLVELPPGQPRLIGLQSDSNCLEPSPSGLHALPVRLKPSTGPRRDFELSVPVLTALPGDGQIEIDGDLADWPPGSANVASGFSMITYQHRHGTADTPRSSTLALALRDARYLYIAVNCTTAEDPQTAMRASGLLGHEDFLPTGGEQVEILIDPLNARTRNPNHLYRLAVARGGAHRAQQPAADGSNTPRHWPVDVAVATNDQPGRWIAELRIPFDAFGQAQTRRTIWGLNLTRFDEFHQELSTWSGARGNAYDPLSLGNLYLP